MDTGNAGDRLAPLHLHGTEDFIDEIVFKGCMVPSQHEIPPTTTSDTAAAVEALTESRDVFNGMFYGTNTNFGGVVDASRPPEQPGAGIYTSPLTVNVDRTLSEVVSVIAEVLVACQMPHIYDSTRFKGDRILTTRLFEFVTAALKSNGVVDMLRQDFNHCMFDWAPAKLPEEVLSRLPKPSDEAVRAGLQSIAEMVSSMYDDVSVNGCASVARLASASSITRASMAACLELVACLLNVVLGTPADAGSGAGARVVANLANAAAPWDPQYSFDTRTNAAMAVSVLTEVTAGQHSVLACRAGTGHALLELCRLAVSAVREGAPAVAEFEIAYLQAYCIVIVANVCSGAGGLCVDVVAQCAQSLKCFRDGSEVPLTSMCAALPPVKAALARFDDASA